MDQPEYRPEPRFIQILPIRAASPQSPQEWRFVVFWAGGMALLYIEQAAGLELGVQRFLNDMAGITVGAALLLLEWLALRPYGPIASRYVTGVVGSVAVGVALYFVEIVIVAATGVAGDFGPSGSIDWAIFAYVLIGQYSAIALYGMWWGLKRDIPVAGTWIIVNAVFVGISLAVWYTAASATGYRGLTTLIVLAVQIALTIWSTRMLLTLLRPLGQASTAQAGPRSVGP